MIHRYLSLIRNELTGRVHLSLLRHDCKRNKLEPMLVLGDSHSLFFSGYDDFALASIRQKTLGKGIYTCKDRRSVFAERFIVFHLGQGLAYNTIAEESSTKVRRKTKWICDRFARYGGVFYVVLGK